jgi:hypothetical protein
VVKTEKELTAMSVPQFVATVTMVERRYATGLRYGWSHQRHPGCTVYSSQDFATAWAAWLAAANIAIANRARLAAPAHVQDQLIAYWALRGRRLFNDGQVRSLCANQYERAAWDLAAAELDAQIAEVIGKPALDFAPTTVYAHEMAVA